MRRVAWLGISLAAMIGVAAADVPKPRPRPDGPGGGVLAPLGAEAAGTPAAPTGAETLPPEGGEPGVGPGLSGPARGSNPVFQIERPPFDAAAAKACEADLTALGARFVVREEIAGAGGCGAPRPVEMSAVGSVELRPPLVARCPLARAFGRWVADVVKPSATLYLGEEPIALATAGSYQCRARSGDAGKVSEHALANAVDISGAEFARRGGMTVRDWTGSADPGASFQAAIRGGACAYFTTVLGPGTDPDHADHLHMDLEARRNGYRICQ